MCVVGRTDPKCDGRPRGEEPWSEGPFAMLKLDIVDGT